MREQSQTGNNSIFVHGNATSQANIELSSLWDQGYFYEFEIEGIWSNVDGGGLHAQNSNLEQQKTF